MAIREISKELLEQLLRGLFIYSTASYFTELVIHYLACKIINKKVPWIKICLASFIVAVLVCPILYFGSAGFIFGNMNQHLSSYLLDMICVTANILSIFLILERQVLKAVIAGTFAYFIFFQSYMISLIFVPTRYTLDSLKNQTISIAILLLFTLLLGRLIPRMNAAYFVNWCLRNRKYSIMVSCVGILLAGSTNLILMLINSLKELNAILVACALCLLLLFFFLYQFVSRNVLHDEHERFQGNIIAQQTGYIQTLEEIQKEVRLYRHDFKNMMAGLYLDVQQGNIAAVEQYMQDLLSDFDRNLDQKIQISNQLANVQIIELKSLLLTKLNQMDVNHLKYQIEVLYPLSSCAMDTPNLLRCIGIILDNAIEYIEVQGGDIDIMITAQRDYTNFLISNSLIDEINMSQIWHKGFSTKGEDRGLGLFSYQEITKRYANVNCLTTCRAGRFCQELRIGGRNNDKYLAM